jgi:hypothetical protein
MATNDLGDPTLILALASPVFFDLNVVAFHISSIALRSGFVKSFLHLIATGCTVVRNKRLTL